MAGWQATGTAGRWRYQDDAGRQLLLVDGGVYVTLSGDTFTVLFGPKQVVSDEWPMGLPGEDSPLELRETHIIVGASTWADSDAWARMVAMVGDAA